MTFAPDLLDQRGGLALSRVRNFLFFSAVILMNYTLSRPSPVDIVFLISLYVAVIAGTRIHLNFIIYAVLMVVWMFSVYFSSIDLIHDSTVRFELLAKTFVVVLGLTATFVASSWRQGDFETFLKVYIVSCAIGATLGIVGFVTVNELLTWDTRAKGLIDDPNMYAAFLVPGVLACLYMLALRRRVLLYSSALTLLLVGIVFSFSRAALGALAVCAPLYLAFLNRRQVLKTTVYAFVLIAVAAALLAIAHLTLDNFGEKVVDRLTLAKDYDAGHGGRYNRYLLSLPLILDHPFGLGLEQIKFHFPEPIHNFHISSFLNYGWLAGSTWILLMILSVKLSWNNYVATRSPIVVLLFFCFLSQALCIGLHEGEHWRHLWLFMGLVWGFNVRQAAVSAAQCRRDYALRRI